MQCGSFSIKQEENESMGNKMTMIKVHWNPEYANQKDSYFFYHLLKSIKREQSKGRHIEVMWFYPSDNREVKMMGKDFQSLVDLSFVFIEYNKYDLEDDEFYFAS